MGVMEKEKEAMLMKREAARLEAEAERVRQLNELTVKLNAAHDQQKQALVAKHDGKVKAMDERRAAAFAQADEYMKVTTSPLPPDDIPYSPNHK